MDWICCGRHVDSGHIVRFRNVDNLVTADDSLEEDWGIDVVQPLPSVSASRSVDIQ